MKKLIRWFDWELKNEFTACGYLCVMLFCYAIVELVYGQEEVNVRVLLQMFLLNYGISTIQRIFFNQEKDYENREYYKRAGILVVLSFVAMMATCHFFSWFKGCSIAAEIFMYVCMIASYLFVWLMAKVMKQYDTKELNEELERFKQLNQ